MNGPQWWSRLWALGSWFFLLDLFFSFSFLFVRFQWNQILDWTDREFEEDSVCRWCFAVDGRQPFLKLSRLSNECSRISMWFSHLPESPELTKLNEFQQTVSKNTRTITIRKYLYLTQIDYLHSTFKLNLFSIKTSKKTTNNQLKTNKNKQKTHTHKPTLIPTPYNTTNAIIIT